MLSQQDQSRFPDRSGDIAYSAPEVIIMDDVRAFVQKVYTWMLIGLSVTGLTAYLVASSEQLVAAIFGTPIFWVIMLAPLAMVWFLSARINKIQASTAVSLFIAYSLVNGLAFSTIFIVYELGSVGSVFLIAAGMFGAAAFYGYVTQRDLSSFGSFLFMGVIGIIIAMVVNFFLQSSLLDFAISIIGVFIFTGLAATRMQEIRNNAGVVAGGEAVATKAAIIGALGLYLAFVNLFLFLLRLLGNRR